MKTELLGVDGADAFDIDDVHRTLQVAAWRDWSNHYGTRDSLPNSPHSASPAADREDAPHPDE